MNQNSIISFQEFDNVDIRVGVIVKAEEFPEARKPAFKLYIDFGEAIGTKKSSAQITVNYKLDELVGKKVLAVVNFEPRQVGPFMSEVLTLGTPLIDGSVLLVDPGTDAIVGAKLF